MCTTSLTTAVLLCLTTFLVEAAPTASDLSPRYYRSPSLAYPAGFTATTCPVITNLFIHGQFAPFDYWGHPHNPQDQDYQDRAQATTAREQAPPTPCAVLGQIILKNDPIAAAKDSVKATYTFNTTTRCTYTLDLKMDRTIKSVVANLIRPVDQMQLPPFHVEPNAVNAQLVFKSQFDTIANYTVTFDAEAPPKSVARDVAKGVSGFAALIQTCE